MIPGKRVIWLIDLMWVVCAQLLGYYCTKLCME